MSKVFFSTTNFNVCQLTNYFTFLFFIKLSFQVTSAVAKAEQDWLKKLKEAESKADEATAKLKEEQKCSTKLRECLNLIQKELDSAKNNFHKYLHSILI